MYGDCDDNSYFFCGVSKPLVLSAFFIDINCPLSTSSSFTVAMNFAANGIIVEFGLNAVDQEVSLFSCGWLSDFPDEEERLFYGEQVQKLLSHFYPSSKCVIE